MIKKQHVWRNRHSWRWWFQEAVEEREERGAISFSRPRIELTLSRYDVEWQFMQKFTIEFWMCRFEKKRSKNDNTKGFGGTLTCERLSRSICHLTITCENMSKQVKSLPTNFYCRQVPVGTNYIVTKAWCFISGCILSLLDPSIPVRLMSIHSKSNRWWWCSLNFYILIAVKIRKRFHWCLITI